MKLDIAPLQDIYSEAEVDVSLHIYVCGGPRLNHVNGRVNFLVLTSGVNDGSELTSPDFCCGGFQIQGAHTLNPHDPVLL